MVRIALVAAGALVPATAATAAARPLVGPYFTAPFKVSTLPYAFGQDPSWTRHGDVLSAELDRGGLTQIYRARPDGRRQRCLTCRTVPGPNGLPQERPQGDWILFQSYGRQPTHFGGPGLGGYGGDLYVMRPEGSHPYRLTTDSDPDHGAVYTTTSGVPYDNFHAYWSPDGKHVIWTHTEAHPLNEGGQTWSMLLGDVVVRHGRPALRNVRVVGRPYGAYETQPWSPDGRGFLFFAAGGRRSPYQRISAGWGNARVYYMRLYGRGASPRHPRVTLIGDNEPVYQEQAIFTPDMRTVLEMSNRGASNRSWYDLVATAAQRTGFDAPDTGSTGTLQFLADFLGPEFRADLYAVDVRTGAFRRLTHLNRVIPEFYWNHDATRIIWGLGGQPRAKSYTARFTGITARQRRIPRHTPRPLRGRPVRMSRVGAQAQPVRDSGPTDNVPVRVRPPAHPARAFPHARERSDAVAVPAVTGTYVGRWLSDLEALGVAANDTFTTAPLTRFDLGR